MLVMVANKVESERQVQSGMGPWQVGSGPVILSHIYNFLLATEYLHTLSSQQSPHLLLFEAALQGIAQSWTISGVTTKTKFISGVYSLFWEGVEIVLSAATSRTLQLNCAVPENLYRVKRSGKKLSVCLSAKPKKSK